jgi:Arc/MetJ-type ribon-helix-helix transcriptional regulator
MPITTTRPATASGFFERRAEHIRQALKDVDDRIAERESLKRKTETTYSELDYYRRKRNELKRELRNALFNKGRS